MCVSFSHSVFFFIIFVVSLAAIHCYVHTMSVNSVACLLYSAILSLFKNCSVHNTLCSHNLHHRNDRMCEIIWRSFRFTDGKTINRARERVNKYLIMHDRLCMYVRYHKRNLLFCFFSSKSELIHKEERTRCIMTTKRSKIRKFDACLSGPNFRAQNALKFQWHAIPMTSHSDDTSNWPKWQSKTIIFLAAHYVMPHRTSQKYDTVSISRTIKLNVDLHKLSSTFWRSSTLI